MRVTKVEVAPVKMASVNWNDNQILKLIDTHGEEGIQEQLKLLKKKIKCVWD